MGDEERDAGDQGAGHCPEKNCHQEWNRFPKPSPHRLFPGPALQASKSSDVVQHSKINLARTAWVEDRHGQLFDALIGTPLERRYLKLIRSVRLSVEALGFKGSFVAFALF